MAIQINIEYEFKFPNHVEKKDFYVDIQDNYEYLFSFCEMDDYSLTIRANQGVKVEIESYQDEANIQIPIGEKIQISSGKLGNNYFPGYFTIIFTLGNETYYHKFRVLPNQYEYENVIYLREYVNSYYSGLSQYVTKKSNVNSIQQNNKSNNVYETIKFFTNDFSKTISLINAYNNRPYTEIIKEPKVTSKIRKMDAKSTKWLLTKGLSRNQDIYKPDHVLANKPTITNKTNENAAFLYLLSYWNNELKKALLTINTYINNSKHNLILLNRQLEEYSTSYSNIKDDYTISDSLKRNRKERIQRIKDDVSTTNYLIQEYLGYKNLLRKYSNNMQKYMTLDYLDGLEITPLSLNHHLRDQRLRMIVDHRNQYLKTGTIRNQKNKNNQLGFREKSTPDLYETYTYILLINILQSLGYELVQNESNTDLMYNLSHASTFTLKKDDQYCDIIYDKELPKSTSQFNKSEYCYINSFHNRPDFILSFYKEGQIPYHTLVIDSKWRGKQHIYNEFDDTEVVLALKDYLNIAYYDINSNKRYRGIVSKVFAIFPDANNEVITIQDDDIQAIGILPSQDMFESKNYHYLCDCIKNCLD